MKIIPFKNAANDRTYKNPEIQEEKATVVTGFIFIVGMAMIFGFVLWSVA